MSELVRNPTLKISKSLLLSTIIEFSHLSSEELYSKIVKAASTQDFKHRSLICVKKDKVTKVKNTLESTDGDFELLNGVLSTERKNLQHVGIFVIKRGSKDYNMALEIVEYANDFCRAFELTKAEGYRKYTRFGLKLMGKKYGLSKFKYYNAKIFEHFESIHLLKNDSDSEITNYMYNVWRHQMGKHKVDLQESLAPERLVSFLFARQQVEKIKGDYKNWIIAQFEHFSFLNVVPEFSQFYGDTAQDRYFSHMAKLKLRLKDEGKSLVILTREEIINSLKLR